MGNKCRNPAPIQESVNDNLYKPAILVDVLILKHLADTRLANAESRHINLPAFAEVSASGARDLQCAGVFQRSPRVVPTVEKKEK